MKEGLRNENPRLEGDYTQPKNAWEVSLEDLPAGSQQEAMESAGFSNKADWKYATEMGFYSADEFYKSLANKPYDQLTFREKGILEGITRPDQETQITEADTSDYIENQANQPLQLGFNPENSSLDYLDKLRQEAFAKGGADDADFAKYNQLYTEKLSEIKGRIEADKQNQPLALEYSGNNSSDIVSLNQEGVVEGLVAEDSGKKSDIQVQIVQPSNETIELSDAEFTVSKQKRADRAKKVVDQDDNIEAKAGRSREFMKRAGKAVLGIVALVGFGAIAFVAGRRSAEQVHVNNSEPKVEDNTRTELSESSASEFNKLANFDNSNAQEQEKNFNNGKYDSENDDYNKIDQKESKYSIGTDTSKLSNEEYQKKMIESHNEDDIEYMGQFFVNDTESAQNLLGISNTEVDDLVDAARNGDQTAFQKLNDAYSKYMEGAKVVGNQTLDGDYYSLFVNSNKDYAHAEGAFGGTARIVELKNGQQILIRDQCKQMVMKKIAEIPNTWTTPVIPFEEAYTPPAPNTENPPAPTPETPPETPPTTPETPPQELEAKDPTKDINVNANLNPEAKVDGQKFEVNTNEGNQQDEIQEVPNVYEAPAAQPDLNIQPSVDLANETVVGQGNVEVTPQYRADGWINDTTSQTWESAYNNGGTQVEAQEGTNGSAGINTGRVE